MAVAASLALPEERPGSATPPSILAGREGMAAAVAAGTWQTDPPPVEAVLGGVRVLRFRPARAIHGTILHFHGGGFRLGCPEYAGPYAAALAKACGVELVCPAYRLAPEHPFPAGLIDARAVMRSLASAGGGPLILSGDSAGGGIAAGLAVLAQTDAIQLAGLLLLSPWLDLTVSAPTFDTNAATDSLFSREAAQLAADLYLQGLLPSHPLASPVFAPVLGFPPTYISIGEDEVLADDGRRFHARLSAEGVRADLHTVAGMEHVAVVRGMALPTTLPMTLRGAAETFAAVTAFVDQLLNTTP